MSAQDDGLYAAMSAVMDGSATPAEWARVNAAWSRDPALRERWALWHAAGDGLRSTELAALRREPQALLDALHAHMQAPVGTPARPRDWLAPFAVAAGFVAMAVGVGVLRPPPSPDPVVSAAAPFAAPRAQGLGGLSFAQAAAGRTLPALGVAQEAGLPAAAPEAFDWGLAAPEPAPSRPRP